MSDLDRRRRRSRRVLPVCALGAILAVGLLAGCSSDDGDNASASDSPSTTASEAPGTAVITQFEAPPSVTCDVGDTSTTITATYAVTGAKSQELRVDGLPTGDTKSAEGTVSADVRCDPLPHDLVLIAKDADGHRTTQRLTFTTTTATPS